MGASADVYKPITDILHQWLSIPEYIHKMFKSMHVQVSHGNKCLLERFLTLTVFGDSEGLRFNNEIIMCCYVRYMLKYALKSAVKVKANKTK